MKPQKEPIHINAKKADIAPVVLMPGDPLRAKYIAENFLFDAKLVTSVRNMLGYTGYYKGNRITVMGSGMGLPSMGIYCFELFYYYNVQKIIRIGTCGVVNPKVEIPEIIVADKVWSESRFAYSYNGFKGDTVTPSMNLTNKIIERAKKSKQKIRVGALMTTEVIGPYVDDEALVNRAPKYLDVLGEEMEAYALIHVANSFKREAAAIVTAVDSKFSDKILSIEERQTSLDNMIKLGLDALI